MAFAARKLPDEPVLVVTIDVPIERYISNVRSLNAEIGHQVQRMTGALQAVQQVLTTEQLQELQKKAGQVYVDPALIEYAVRMVSATRSPPRHRAASTAAAATRLSARQRT